MLKKKKALKKIAKMMFLSDGNATALLRSIADLLCDVGYVVRRDEGDKFIYLPSSKLHFSKKDKRK